MFNINNKSSIIPCNSIFKMICIIAFVLLYSIHANASTGWCSTDGGTISFDADFTYNYTGGLSSTQSNIIYHAYTWDLGNTYTVTCSCSGSSVSYFKSTAGDLGEIIYSDATNIFYKINEYLAVASSIYIGGNYKQFQATPFSDITSNSATPCSSYAYSTGSKGELSLYFTKPFIGSLNIPPVVVARIFATRVKGSYSSVPISQVSVSGVITVPQTCQINDGQIIDIDYGKIIGSSMKTKGVGPDGFSAVVTQVAYVCTNIDEGVKIAFTFTGEASGADPQSLKTSNADTGIRIEDMNGQAITPNTGKLSTLFDAAAQKGSASFKSYPVNVTGSIPAPGAFSATATITSNIE